jgi:cytochrome P450
MKLFRKDILSAQPARLYHAWMAGFKTPFFRSYMINQPELIDEVLKARPDDFPKSDRIGEGLRPLLGNSVFLTNGETWKRQRRIIDPAFEGGRLRDTFGAMQAAAEAMVARLSDGAHEIEKICSYAAADVIFRTLFSIPIDHEDAKEVFEEFRRYQREQPILNIAAFVPLLRWVPRGHSRTTRDAARRIRALITKMTEARMEAIARGSAPNDLATKIMTMADPETGERFSTEKMVDQVGIFFLAGHETSASALAWSLYMMALYPAWQAKVAAEAGALEGEFAFSDMSKLRLSRDVFRETLRLYPPVPMMVRETTCPEHFRDRDIKTGAQVVISPWHLHRHERIWDRPDAFDPARWGTDEGRKCAREAFLPFSAGARVCPGAGFAMVEGPLLLSSVLRAFEVQPVGGKIPQPVAHLTVRAKDGIYLNKMRHA